MMIQWTKQEILRVSAESLVDARTIRRFLEGKKPVRDSSIRNIVETAKRLGLKVPKNGR
jgi:hypothetical protein